MLSGNRLLWKRNGFIIGLLFTLVFLCMPANVQADIGEDFGPIRIEAGSRYFVPLELSTGESLYVRFHVTYGEGIYFFIVDQDGHDDIMSGQAAQTAYEEQTYYAEDGIWRYITFTAHHDSTWYVWFSKVYGAPLAGTAATIEGHARKDIDGPLILEFSVSGDTVLGTAEISYDILDLGYPIASIHLYANDSEVTSISDPEQDHYTIGFDARGKLLWDTTTLPNGQYFIKLEAYDTLGHWQTSDEISVIVNNGFWDYPMNQILVFGIIIFGIMALCYSLSRK